MKPHGDRFDDLRRISIEPPQTSSSNQRSSSSIKRDPSIQPHEWEQFFHEEYVRIVKEYTQRSLTNSADILAAFAGVSRVFENGILKRYNGIGSNKNLSVESVFILKGEIGSRSAFF